MTEQELNPSSELIESVTAPAIDIVTSSLRLLRWAHDHGLLVVSAYYPGPDYEHPTFDSISQDGIILLRQKQIRFIGVNSQRGQISVYLNKVAPGGRASKKLPLTCDGYQLIFRQGATDEVSPTNIAQGANPCAIHVGAQGSFYTCGSSISVGNFRGAGTLTCLLRDGAGGLYGMSNNHVSGACNYAPTGLPIVAPGITDVAPQNPAPFTLGFHLRQLPMTLGDPTVVDTSLNQDVAVFKIADPARISSMQQDAYDTPSLAAPLVPGMEVEKVGRTTGHSRGRVINTITGPLAISYSAPQYNFSGQAYFETMSVVHGLTDRFSDFGDSGSLVVHTDAAGIRYAVGIVVAGGDDSSAPGTKFSLIMPIQPILQRLGMSLVSGHNL
ncbi:trypsin-like serine protease [Herbaspirillum frisingense]|uniref:trypsin-like serine protease n=1 Tax=Herbaspirillum frisingense TaxID=92645 RepID=UPI0039B04895